MIINSVQYKTTLVTSIIYRSYECVILVMLFSQQNLTELGSIPYFED